MPRLWLEQNPDRIAGRVFTSVDAPLELRVRLPEGLRGATIAVDGASSFVVDAEDVVFTVDATPAGADWAVFDGG